MRMGEKCERLTVIEESLFEPRLNVRALHKDKKARVSFGVMLT